MLVVRFDQTVRRRWILTLAFFGALLLVRGAWELASVMPAGARAAAPMREVAGGSDAVTLTFNITWGERVPSALLSRLEQLEVRATFFVSGPWAEGHPDLIRRMAAGGHDVASLGHELVNLTAADDARIEGEILASVTAIRAAGAPPPVFFRPPGGAYDDRVLAAAVKHGLRTVLWSVDARDWLTPGSDVIVRTVLDHAQPGSIVLLHASDGNEQTLRAVDALVQGLRGRGLRPVPLSELAGPGQT